MKHVLGHSLESFIAIPRRDARGLLHRRLLGLGCVLEISVLLEVLLREVQVQFDVKWATFLN